MPDVYKQSFKQNYTNNIELSIFNCGLERCAPGQTWGPGIRDHYLIHLVVSGKGIFEVGGRTWEVSEGDLFFARPSQLIRYTADYGYYPWPMDKDQTLPTGYAKGWVWNLMTGVDGAGKRFASSYVPPWAERMPNGSYLGLRCPLHDNQRSAPGSTGPVNSYIFVGSNSQVNYADNSVGITGLLATGSRSAVRPEKVRNPSVKIGIIEREKDQDNFGMGYIDDGRYLYNSSSKTPYIGPVHGKNAGYLCLDGHAGMINVVAELNADGNAYSTHTFNLWKMYFATNHP